MMRKQMLPILFLVVACNTEKKDDSNFIEFKKYYFNVTTTFESDSTHHYVKEEIATLLPLKKYAITNTSGKAWPFFVEKELEAKIDKNELMPPHTIGHQLIDIEKFNDAFNEDDAQLNIVISKEDDGNYNVEMTVDKWNNTTWVQQLNLGRHQVTKREYNTNEELVQVLYKTIVRYSFK